MRRGHQKQKPGKVPHSKPLNIAVQHLSSSVKECPTNRRNLVHLTFGRAVPYVTLSPEEAVSLAEALIRMARNCQLETEKYNQARDAAKTTTTGDAPVIRFETAEVDPTVKPDDGGA